jgi:hypothetical protein
VSSILPLSPDVVWNVALVLIVWLGYVFLGGLLLLVFGRSRRDVGRWAERQLTLGRRGGGPVRRCGSELPVDMREPRATRST